MPTIDALQQARPCCPGLFSNFSHGGTNRQLCGRAMQWDHAAGRWCCAHHGPRLDGDEAAARLED
jgi:hypothetical protein